MSATTSAASRTHHDIETSSKAFWQLPFDQQLDVYDRLRSVAPVSWQRPVEDAVSPDPDDPGYWAVVNNADIVTVSRNHEVFISGEGVLFDLLPSMVLEMTQSFLAMDPPRHNFLRRLVSSAFTPRRVARIEDQIRRIAKEIVDDIAPLGEIDFVADCARRLPLQVFCEMFGVPEDQWDQTGEAADKVVAWADPEALGDREPDEVQIEGALFLHELAEQMAAERRQEPKDDLMTNLVEAEVEGDRLDDFEIGAFFVLMAVAATDTTKHTASVTAQALCQHPDQRDWWFEDYDARCDTAIEEILRWGSVVMTFRRTAVAEYELGGQLIEPGDKVVMFYPAGSFDPAAIDDPRTFDLARRQNPHSAFGGGGIHYCLGAQLAKSQLRALFRELRRIPDLQTGAPEHLGTNFMRGIKRMPATFTPER